MFSKVMADETKTLSNGRLANQDMSLDASLFSNSSFKRACNSNRFLSETAVLILNLLPENYFILMTACS